MSDSLQAHELQHARLPCPSLSPGARSNTCPLSCWHHPTISSSVAPLSCFQCSPASVFSSEPSVCIRWPKYWSFSFSISPSNEYSDWFFFLGLTGLTSLVSRGLSRVFFGTTIQKHQFFSIQPSLWSKSHIPSMGVPDHLTCLLRNLYPAQEATVRNRHGTTHWFQIGKGVYQDCILSPCLFNLYADYIMWNAGLDEAQAGIKIARRNSNNLRYADATHHP